MKSNSDGFLYEIFYRHLYGYGETEMGLLAGIHPVDWWEQNKSKVELIQWTSVLPHEVEGVPFVPLMIEHAPYHVDLM